MFKRIATVLGLSIAFAMVSPAKASLVGTNVTGNLSFGGGPTNYFDAANGFVPATGYENSGGATTVAISDANIEFGYMDILNTDTADFTDNTLTVSDAVSAVGGGTNGPVTMTFTDTAFAGLSVNEITDTLPGGATGSIIGDTLTVSIPFSSAVADSTTYTAVFDFSGGSLGGGGGGGSSVPLPRGAIAGVLALTAMLALRKKLLAQAAN